MLTYVFIHLIGFVVTLMVLGIRIELRYETYYKWHEGGEQEEKDKEHALRSLHSVAIIVSLLWFICVPFVIASYLLDLAVLMVDKVERLLVKYNKII